jgi:hypothetical protein
LGKLKQACESIFFIMIRISPSIERGCAQALTHALAMKTHPSPLAVSQQTLNFVLSLKRPHGGSGVAKVVQYLRRKHPQAIVDACGNVHIDLRGRCEKQNPGEEQHEQQAQQEQKQQQGLVHDLVNVVNPSPTKFLHKPVHKTLFVAHLDTVHRKDGVNRYRVEAGKLLAKGAPLGADDGAGIAILMALLHAKVPAYYVFTQGEEVGGVGAKYLRRHYPALLAQFDRAVAFDRRSTISVISHQGMGRCCSDVFATALSDGLNGLGMMMQPDDSGIYTDTAEWTDVIAECTNVSCGYFNEHSADEWLDLNHFNDLVKAVVQLDWDALPLARDPNAFDPSEIDWYGSGVSGLVSRARHRASRQAGRLAWLDGVENRETVDFGTDAGGYADASSVSDAELAALGGALDIDEDVCPGFDAACYRLMQAIELAEEGDDFCLKQLMVDAMPCRNRTLIAEMLRPMPISLEALDFGYEAMGFLDTREVLLGMLELMDASLV